MPTMQKLTPVLVVERIEPVLPFWVDRLGFEKAIEVPGDGGLGFVAFRRDGVEVMYQTRASLQADIPKLAAAASGRTFLFLEVRDLNGVAEALEGVEHLIPRRRTFYGADEIVVRDPVGHVIVFAEFEDEGEGG